MIWVILYRCLRLRQNWRPSVYKMPIKTPSSPGCPPVITHSDLPSHVSSSEVRWEQHSPSLLFQCYQLFSHPFKNISFLSFFIVLWGSVEHSNKRLIVPMWTSVMCSTAQDPTTHTHTHTDSNTICVWWSTEGMMLILSLMEWSKHYLFPRNVCLVMFGSLHSRPFKELVQHFDHLLTAAFNRRTAPFFYLYSGSYWKIMEVTKTYPVNIRTCSYSWTSHKADPKNQFHVLFFCFVHVYDTYNN